MNIEKYSMVNGWSSGFFRMIQIFSSHSFQNLGPAWIC